MKIALIGYSKIRKMTEQIAKDKGHEIVSIIDAQNQEDFDNEAFASTDVAIEFTSSTVAYGNYLHAFTHDMKVMNGSTGWMKKHGEDIKRLYSEGRRALFWTLNFSLSVTIFSAVNRYLARIMSDFPQYEVRIEETHHIHKLDALSGTAITLAEEVIDEIDRKHSWMKGIQQAADGGTSDTDDVAADQLAIDSVRRGEVPGIHTVTYDCGAGRITVSHNTHNRTSFALGAVLAAEYTATRTGLFTTSDLFRF